MKKNNILLLLLCSLPALSWCNDYDIYDYVEEGEESSFSFALTTGYVFKHDFVFKEVYGHGIQNVITADGCYYPWESWGLGAKVSYWLAKGETTFLQQCTKLQEIPITFYLRGITDCWRNLQGYASLGGGVILIKEQSYIGCVRRNKGIGEFEVGFNYLTNRCFDITGAFRYLFPNERIDHQKRNIGGFDLRAGIVFSY